MRSYSPKNEVQAPRGLGSAFRSGTSALKHFQHPVLNFVFKPSTRRVFNTLFNRCPGLVRAQLGSSGCDTAHSAPGSAHTPAARGSARFKRQRHTSPAPPRSAPGRCRAGTLRAAATGLPVSRRRARQDAAGRRHGPSPPPAPAPLPALPARQALPHPPAARSPRPPAQRPPTAPTVAPRS